MSLPPSEPTLDDRPARPYVAKSLVTTLDGLEAGVPRLWSEVSEWLAARGQSPTGDRFIRYLEIDMPKRIEVHVGLPVAAPLEGDERIVNGVLPAGRYASLVFVGAPDGLVAANAELQGWAEGRGLTWASYDGPRGTVWEARLETYRAAHAEAGDGTQQVEVAYLIRPEAAGRRQ